MNGNVSQLQMQKVHKVWWMLKLGYGLVPIVAGLDKLGFDLIVHWAQYLHPMVASLIPLSVPHILFAVGIIEIIAGLLVLTKWTRLGAYIVAAWLTVIAVSLVAMGKFYDIAVRDLLLALGALSLAMLTEVQEGK